MAYDANHGMSNTRIYRVWRDMKNRCLNPNNAGYVNYGGRGITVCAEWLEFIPFYTWATSNGYTETLFIDRIDNELGYNPENCRFVTRQVQQANRRSFKGSSSKYLGIYKTPRNTWAAKVKISGRNQHIGCYPSELEAAHARDAYIKTHNLPLKLNIG